jgi:hypothetical protein
MADALFATESQLDADERIKKITRLRYSRAEIGCP